MTFEQIQIPESGEKISLNDEGQIDVPDNPIIAFIEGDGAGPDIWRCCKNVIDSAVERAFNLKKEIHWMEIFAGDKAIKHYEELSEPFLPEETLNAMRDYLITLSGPLLSKGNKPSAHKDMVRGLDLYSNMKSISWISGIPAPFLEPDNVNMTLFCENTEDVFAGFDFEAADPFVEQLKELLDEFELLSNLKFQDTMALSVLPITKQGTLRLAQSAIDYAIENDRDSVTFVHQGNLLTNTEENFKKWAYEAARSEYLAKELSDSNWCTLKNPKSNKTITIKDSNTDHFIQEALTRPIEYDVIATMGTNGRFIADLLSAQIGLAGLYPDADINFETSAALFKSNYGADHKFAGQNKVNPIPLILAGEMMLRYLSWDKAADLISEGMKQAIKNKTVTYDLARKIDDAKTITCYDFGLEIINNMP